MVAANKTTNVKNEEPTKAETITGTKTSTAKTNTAKTSTAKTSTAKTSTTEISAEAVAKKINAGEIKLETRAMTPEEITQRDSELLTPVIDEYAFHSKASIAKNKGAIAKLKGSAKLSVDKTMGNTDQNECRKNVKDVQMFGDDLFKLLSKASSESEGWMKSTKAMDIGKGCVVQVTTQQRNPDNSYSVAEALTFVPGVKLKEVRDSSGIVTGRTLVGVR